MKTKKCKRCNQIKSIDCFYFNERYRDGMVPWCKQCKKDYISKRRKTEPQNLKDAALNKEKRKETKRIVLTHYGHGTCKCVWCGESRMECLSLDHIKDDGEKLRRAGIEPSGYMLYRRLLNQGFPEGYQTFCMNCQWIKAARHRKRKSK